MDETAPPIQDLINPTTEQPILVMISHSHHRPLSSPPNLKFDLRKVSNPPKHIRDAYDGRSKRLREHMMHMEVFTSLLDTAKKSIEDEMAVLIQSRNERHEATLAVSEEKEEDASEFTDKDAIQLVVSCFCERGKHRSVAFAEELSRHKWPRDWAVQLHHRDVDEVTGKRKYQRTKGNPSRKMQGNHGFDGSDMD